jgi:hypothetical protein
MELIKAICIDNIRDGRSLKNLTKDKEYEIKESSFDGYFEIINDEGKKETYFKSRFKVLEDKKGVRCINGNGNYLNTGELYNIEEEKENFYLIKIDGIERMFKKSRFEVVEDEKMEGEEYKDIKSLQDEIANNLSKPTNYEEEYKKLIVENENLKNKNAILTQDNYSLKELAKGRGEYNEKLEKELNSKDAYWENYLTEIKTEYDCLLIKLEKAVNTLSSENEQLKKENEIIPVMKTEIDYLISENKKLKENGNDKFKVIIKKLCEVISLYN